MDRVYLMGFDAWAGGKIVSAYLDSCRNSAKYKKGAWYLLEEGKRGPAASLIVYRLSSDSAGIGSIAVSPKRRGKGLATLLIQDVLRRLDRRGISLVFLFSDIDPAFYERFGFKALPAKRREKGGHVCMIRGRTANADDLKPPAYF